MEKRRVRSLPVISPEERVKNFVEIVGSVKPQWAVAESFRCTLCNDAPCVDACPAHVDIPKFIRKIRSRSFKAAARVIRERNPFVSICGRVCPQEELCEKACLETGIKEPVAIGALQRFVGDGDLAAAKPAGSMQGTAGSGATGAAASGKRVAVIGSGPSSIACAVKLTKLGYGVEIFEAASEPGGLPARVIPRFRLPHDVFENEFSLVLGQGIDLRASHEVAALQPLFDGGFRAIFLGIGLARSISPGFEGGNLEGVCDWRDFLERASGGDMELRGVTAVIGGGNAAVDCACSALRLGSDRVRILYRRTEEEMPAWKKEIRFAKEEGVEITFRTAPVEFTAGEAGNVIGVRCLKTEPGPEDPDGRRKPVPVAGSEHDIQADTVITALGQAISDKFLSVNPTLETDRHGRILVQEETGMTSLEGVFAGGDVVNGGGTVVQAVAEGIRAAEGIHLFLSRSGW